jgi:AcrR family transcriptional regulator
MVSQERKPDRRIQRTRQLLRDALMQLIVEKGYDTLTVQDITDRADVARTTFYLHYKDIDDLLFNSVAEMYEDLMTSGEPFRIPIEGEPGSGNINAADFEHVQKHADFYRAMLSAHGSMNFLLRVLDYLAQLTLRNCTETLPPGIQPRVPLDLFAYFWAGAEIGTMIWWLKQNNLRHSPEEMARFGEILAFSDIRHLLGMNTPAKPDDS